MLGIATAESQPLDLDSGVNGSAAAILTVGNIHAFLLRYDRDGQRVPDLTESVERVEPTRVRATLRSGLTFHDGMPARPADVIYSVARLQDPRTASLQLENLKPIKDMTVRGNAVEFELDGPVRRRPRRSSRACRSCQRTPDPNRRRIRSARVPSSSSAGTRAT